MNKDELWKTLNQKSRSIETGMDSLDRKRTGSYYTDLSLTDMMMDELVETMHVSKEMITRLKFLNLVLELATLFSHTSIRFRISMTCRVRKDIGL